MGSYGIGIERIVAAAIEQNHDEDGIIWPLSIAPYQVHILPIDMTDEQVSAVSNELYSTLGEHGLEVLIDDREESPGKKFKDADLIGFPFRINVGARSLKEGKVELKPRHEKSVLRIEHSQVLSTLERMMEESKRVEGEKLRNVSETNIFT
jgi:prolyl-tRNA synthetase